MPFTQEERFLKVQSPLGEDKLLLERFSGREELSRPFSFKLEMISEDLAIDPKDIVGKSVTFKVERPEADPAIYNGWVRTWIAGGAIDVGDTTARSYHAELVPWFWFLKRHADVRIFQDKTIPEIIEQIFQDRGMTDYELQLRATYPKREYVVQYRETDFDFVSRLMEEHGIFYRHDHSEGTHKMILADSTSGYTDCEEAEVPFSPPWEEHSFGAVENWQRTYDYRSGKWSNTDYDFKDPSADLKNQEKTVVKMVDAKWEMYDFPARILYANATAPKEKNDGKALATVRMEEDEAQHEVILGKSTCPTFKPGCKFKLKAHAIEAEAEGKVCLTSVEHEGRTRSYRITSYEEGGNQYSNNFTAIPDKVTFRPQRLTPKARVEGPHRAKVVGPKGEEIYTDKWGRIKVQFPWDREGKHDDKSTCWMRVAQQWAGEKWGMYFWPRIGHEVIVEFFEGDPDQPFVTGRVYNNDNMPPYTLPDDQTKSGVKTRSSAKGTEEHFNEIRFEDKKDEEEIYIHAEKDFNVVIENNETREVGLEDKDKGDQSIKIFNNQTVSIGEGKTQADDGSQTVDIYKDRTVTLDKGSDKLQIKSGDRTVLIDKGKRAVTIKGDDTLTLKNGNRKVDVKLGKIDEKAMQSITLKVGQNSIKIDQSGITIKGIMVKIQGTAMVDVKAPMTSVKGDAMLKLKGGIIMIN